MAPRNFVAKHAHINRAATFKAKTQYRRETTGSASCRAALDLQDEEWDDWFFDEPWDDEPWGDEEDSWEYFYVEPEDNEERWDYWDYE